MGIPSIVIVCCLILQALSRCEAKEKPPSPIADEIVREARSHIGETKWSKASNYSTGADTNKCNIFVADVIEAAGGSVPARYFFRGIIGAGEWGSRRSIYLGASWCWVNVDRPKNGDVIGYGGHVGIMTGPGKTTSAAQYRVIENNWGFRSGQNPAYWRYVCEP